ncbi:MAG: glutamate--tRNA ligase [Coriobacteriia bacterium]|nr:glutamate--tRNA ligase [Coriobacteriia bacterium]
MTQDVRVRFAPSPTGHLHIGGARTAIYNWAFARHHGGAFVLRIDDTDPERSTTENTQAILRALRWLGLDWDEGPEVGGDFGPYFQTQRSESYADALEHLGSNGHAYPCFCTPEELDAMREVARTRGGFSGYDRTCRDIPVEDARSRVDAGESHVWRVKVPADRGDIVIEDAVRGRVSWPADVMDDFILVRTDGTPTYNFATVVDDWKMGITHIIRGDDHLSNTPRQIVVYEALEAPQPVFAHMSLIFGADGKRLSKRHGATSVEAYRDEGYLPEALLNYLSLLGWSIDDKTTLFDRETLVREFHIERISKNPGVWDPDKLDWMNGVYIREMSAEQLLERVTPLLEDAGLISAGEADERRDWLLEMVSLVSERIKRLDEVVPKVGFLFRSSVEIEESARVKVLEKEGAEAALAKAKDVLAGVEPFESGAIEDALRAIPERINVKPKLVFQSVRVAVTGSMVSPPLFESLALLGKDEAVRRIGSAIALTSG